MRRVFSFYLVVCLSILNLPGYCFASDAKLPEITHKGIDSWPPLERFHIEAEIEAEAQVDLVRVYFKTPDMSHFVFVPMNTDNNENYAAELPAFSQKAEKLEYLFLVKTDDVVVKSQIFPVVISGEPKHTDEKNEDKITIYTEAQGELEAIDVFSDNIILDVVESGVKFGTVAGLYSEAVAGSTGSTGSVTYGGTAVATSGGMSTTSVVISSLAVAAVIGGGAALAAGGGGGGSSTGANRSSSIVGTWNYINSTTNPGVECTVSGQQVFNADGSSYATAHQACDSGYTDDYDFSGSWSLDGTTINIDVIRGPYTGTYVEGSNSFSAYSSSSGWSMDYSR